MSLFPKRPARVVAGHLANLRHHYSRMSTYESGEAGPAIRSAMSALESWEGYIHPCFLPPLRAAAALCEAAENIRACLPRFNGMLDNPWPGAGRVVASLLLSAEDLHPMILDPGQLVLAGLSDGEPRQPGEIICPKCRQTSGNSWSQCGGSCPMPCSPHFKPAAT